MPSKKRKYNARFPAGRIKKIMQTDEEVGKVAQAVPIIISAPRTLELFVESLLTKALRVTVSRNAKTLSPSHVKQCILGEARFDFLRGLVNNIPDVSAAEEKEMNTSAENSPNSSRFTDVNVTTRRLVREDSNSSSSCEARPPLPPLPALEPIKRSHSLDCEVPPKIPKVVTSTIVSSDMAIDLSKKEEPSQSRNLNFYQETLNLSERDVSHSVIRVNQKYGTLPQPSTSQSCHLPPIIREPKTPDVQPNAVVTPRTPIYNIDFTRSLAKPEISVVDPVKDGGKRRQPIVRQYSRRTTNQEAARAGLTDNIELDMNTGALQIDEDYDS